MSFISKDRIEQIVNEMPEGFLWWEGCGHEAGILMDEAIEFATKIHNEALELAARECDSIAWSNNNTAMLGPEYNSTKCAAAIRKLKV